MPIVPSCQPCNSCVVTVNPCGSCGTTQACQPLYKDVQVPTEVQVNEEYDMPVYNTVDVTRYVPVQVSRPEEYTESVTT